MPYYKQTIDDKVVAKACSAELPSGEGWELIEGDPSLVEVWQEPVPPTYNAQEFQQACFDDEALLPLISSVSYAMGKAIESGNWAVVKFCAEKMITDGIATEEEYTLFKAKIIEYHGQDLTEGEQE
jgi:hypothetical protein